LNSEFEIDGAYFAWKYVNSLSANPRLNLNFMRTGNDILQKKEQRRI